MLIGRQSRLHILVIPSEDFVPANRPLSGVFERDQAIAVRAAGHCVGIVSTCMEVSVRSAAISMARSRELRRSDMTLLFRSALRAIRSPHGTHEIRESLPVEQVTVAAWRPPCGADAMRSLRDAGRRGVENYVVRFGRPDIVHAHNALGGGVIALDAKRRFGIPFVVTEHSTAWARNTVPAEFRGLAEEVFTTAAERIMVSPDLGGLLQSQGLFLHSVHIPNIVDDCFLSHPLRSPLTGAGDFTFLNVGAMLEHKGQRDLLDAFATVRRGSRSDVKLRIVGHGPLRKSLEAHAGRRRVTEEVSFVGELSRCAVAEEMANASCVVIPSWQETFGVVAVEAMAMGLPVVATSSGGPECVVTEDTGVIVPPRASDALATAMMEVSEACERFHPTAMRARAKSLYSAESVARKLVSVFTDAVSAA